MRTGAPWAEIPERYRPHTTCVNRWRKAGVWDRLHQVLLDRLGEADRIDWTRIAVDSSTVPAPGGAKKPGRI